MKFIFPKNYNFKSKIFGVIDYSTAILNIIIFCIIFFILKIFLKNLNLKIFFCIIFYFPIFIFSIVGFNNENIFLNIKYILKYLIKPKIYLFNKNLK